MIYFQKPWKIVADFWDSKAQWRTKYFDELKSTADDELPRALAMEKEFVLAEEDILRRACEQCNTVIEFGCGIGRSILPIAAALPMTHFVGIDFSRAQLLIFNSTAASLGLQNAFAVMGDVSEICFRTRCIDLVAVCNQTVGNFLGVDGQKVFREIRRILVPGGRTYIGGFDRIAFASECYKEWGVKVESSGANSIDCGQIPYAAEQGISNVLQGRFLDEQGNYSSHAYSAIARWRSDAGSS